MGNCRSRLATPFVVPPSGRYPSFGSVPITFLGTVPFLAGLSRLRRDSKGLRPRRLRILAARGGFDRRRICWDRSQREFPDDRGCGCQGGRVEVIGFARAPGIAAGERGSPRGRPGRDRGARLPAERGRADAGAPPVALDRRAGQRPAQPVLPDGPRRHRRSGRGARVHVPHRLRQAPQPDRGARARPPAGTAGGRHRRGNRTAVPRRPRGGGPVGAARHADPDTAGSRGSTPSSATTARAQGSSSTTWWHWGTPASR